MGGCVGALAENRGDEDQVNGLETDNDGEERREGSPEDV